MLFKRLLELLIDFQLLNFELPLFVLLPQLNLLLAALEFLFKLLLKNSFVLLKLLLAVLLELALLLSDHVLLLTLVLLELLL